MNNKNVKSHKYLFIVHKYNLISERNRDVSYLYQMIEICHFPRVIHTPRVFVTPSLFIRNRTTQTTRNLLHSNFGTAHCSRRPIEREENKSGKIFSISKEKALGNLIQTDGASRRTRSFGKKSSRYGFVVRAIFPLKQGKVSH